MSADKLFDQRSVLSLVAQIKAPEAELDAAALGGGSQLRAGLLAEAVIKTRPRAALPCLLEPLNQ